MPVARSYASDFSSTTSETFTSLSIPWHVTMINTPMVTKELTSSPSHTTTRLMSFTPSGTRESTLCAATSQDPSLRLLTMRSRLRQLTHTWPLTNTLSLKLPSPTATLTPGQLNPGTKPRPCTLVLLRTRNYPSHT